MIAGWIAVFPLYVSKRDAKGVRPIISLLYVSSLYWIVYCI